MHWMPPPLHTIASLNDQVQVQAWKMPRLPKAQFHLRSLQAFRCKTSRSEETEEGWRRMKKDEEGWRRMKKDENNPLRLTIFNYIWLNGVQLDRMWCSFKAVVHPAEVVLGLPWTTSCSSAWSKFIQILPLSMVDIGLWVYVEFWNSSAHLDVQSPSFRCSKPQPCVHPADSVHLGLFAPGSQGPRRFEGGESEDLEMEA